MDEQERIRAIPLLNSWKMRDETVKAMVMHVLYAWDQPGTGHLARFHPDAFDELFEECEAIMENPI